MEHVETDPESSAEIHRLVDDPRPADDIYGEQPYASRDGERILVRFFDDGDRDGGLSILDLTDGTLSTVTETEPRFPAFHAWGEYCYFQSAAADRLVLERCRFDTAETTVVTTLPDVRGEYSYGTVSPGERYYAVSVEHPDDYRILGIDLESGTHEILARASEQLFKHEQFARDGTSRLLVQANQLPAVDSVLLGVLAADGGGSIDWLAADRPHTPRPTGHEAWVGESDRVLFSTATDGADEGNLWVAGADDDAPRQLTGAPPHFTHVSVSRCGRYWIGDVPGEPDVPIHVGSVATGNHERLLLSRTEHGDRQWSHTHPYLTADNRWLIFNSVRSGHPQVYGARVPEGFLSSL